VGADPAKPSMAERQADEALVVVPRSPILKEILGKLIGL
jgi:hypothetical protein